MATSDPRAWSKSVAVCLIACTATAAFDASHVRQDLPRRVEAVRALFDAGRFAEAEAEAERLFSAAERTDHDQPLDPNAGDLFVEALVRNGRGAEKRTREIAELVVQKKTSELGSSHPSLAISIRNLGDVLYEMGHYAEAIASLRDASNRRETANDPRPSDIADGLDHLARALIETNSLDEALAFINRALALREQETGGGNDLALAQTLRLRGLVHQRKRGYAEARTDFQRAVRLLDASYPSHPETALALRMLGLQLTIEGELTGSRQILSRALTLAEAAMRPDHPDVAAVLGTVAVNLQALGDLAEARTLRQRAVDISQKVFEHDHPIQATRLNDLANVLQLQGEYATALRLYERALDIYQRRLKHDHPLATTALFNLALVNARLGDWREARRQLETVITAWERVLGSEDTSVARAVSALADLLANHGFDREAQRYFERAATIRERKLGPNHVQLAWTLSERARSLARLGQVREALSLAARAIQICETSEAQEYLAAALNIHAQILVTSGDYVAASRAYERSLDIRRRWLGESHPRVAETEIELAAVKGALQNPNESFLGALRGDAINRAHSRVTLAYLPERQALDYASERPKGLDLALSLMGNEQQASQVLDAVVLGRSLVLDELAVRQRVAAGQRSALAPLWSELASARQRYANLVIREPNEQRLEQHAALIDEARRAKEQAERKLAEQSAAFKSELERSDMGLKEVRANLPAGTALISFVRFNRSVFNEKPNATNAAPARLVATRNSAAVPSYAAFVLRPEADAAQVVHLGRAGTLDPLIAQWRRELVTSVTQPTSTPSDAERGLRTTGTALRRKLWDPIAVHLQGVERVYVVPDGAVNLVPLTALPTARSRYLLDDGPVIHYLSAERDLAATDQPPVQTSRGLLAVGGPSFADGSVFAALSRPPGAGRTEPRDTTTPLVNPTSSTRGATNCVGYSSLEFAALPGSRREVQEVAALWRDAGSQEAASQVLLGRDASEGTMKRLAPGQSILHLATHGFFLGGECGPANDKTRSVGGLVTPGKPKVVSASTNSRRQALPENPLLQAGLAFAGANRRAAARHDEDDGILTAEEVASLNLQGIEWAVLSACGTGLGEIKAGEGVFGLRRAFQIAGARTVIMSLWSVDDQATRLWMRALYDGRLNKNLNTADAVREASLAVLRARRARGQSTHPFYWAAFVAAGDWR
jgi:CHAT domain-containing protein